MHIKNEGGKERTLKAKEQLKTWRKSMNNKTDGTIDNMEKNKGQ